METESKNLRLWSFLENFCVIVTLVQIQFNISDEAFHCLRYDDTLTSDPVFRSAEKCLRQVWELKSFHENRTGKNRSTQNLIKRALH